MVRLKGAASNPNTPAETHFNSSMVRLKGAASNPNTPIETYFNSSMVRLKGKERGDIVEQEVRGCISGTW